MINHEFQPKFSIKSRPNLTCKINFYQSQIVLAQVGREFGFQVNDRSRKKLEKLLSMMDGTNTIEQLQQKFFPHQPEAFAPILQSLDEQGFVDGIVQTNLDRGIDTLSELQDLSNDLLDKKSNTNPLWQYFKLGIDSLPVNVLYGFAIEHYYFFSQQCFSQTPSLGWQNSSTVKQAIARLHTQEYEREELLVKALKAIDIARETLTATMPLPETTGLYNALSYWGNFDSLFYFVALGFLSSRIEQNFQLYLQACEQAELDYSFIEAIRKLVNYRLQSQAENIDERIFKEIPYIDRQTKQRFRRQVYLLVEIYDDFYRAIWNHYSSSENLLREIAAI